MLDFRSLKAIPVTVRNVWNNLMRLYTQIATILGEKGRVCMEVDSTAYDIQGTKLFSIDFAICSTVKAETVIAMICERIGLPSWYSVQSHLGSRESDANDPAQVVLAPSTTRVGNRTYPSLPLDTTVTS